MIRITMLTSLLISLLPTHGIAADLAIVGAKIYPSPTSGVIEKGVLIIRDGQIQAIGPISKVRIPKRATVINATGKTITAGFWNSHVHLTSPSMANADGIPANSLSHQLEQMLSRWGFTSVFDLGSGLENTNAIRRRITVGDVRGPTILTTASPFYPNGGTPVYLRQFFKENNIPSNEIGTLDAALVREHAQLKNEADGVKLFTGAIVGGEIGVVPLLQDIATPLAKVAHQNRKPVFSHASNALGLEIAIQSGVDIIAHTTPMTGPWENELIQQMKIRHMALIPTLTLWEVENAKAKRPTEVANKSMAVALQQMQSYHQAGGQILFGTDVGYTDAADTTREFELMGKVFNFRQILATLTTNPSERYGYAKSKGQLATGFDGDVVILAEDPEKDVTAFAKVLYTIRSGKIIYEAPSS